MAEANAPSVRGLANTALKRRTRTLEGIAISETSESVFAPGAKQKVD